MPNQMTDVLTIEVGAQDDPSLYEGWELVEEDSEADEARLDGSVSLKVVKFLEESEDYVDGEEMLRRAKKLGPRVGSRCAKALLRQQDLIPAEWRDNKIPVFPDTVARDCNGDRLVAYLDWVGSRWDLSWTWLDDDFNSRYRVVRLHK